MGLLSFLKNNSQTNNIDLFGGIEDVFKYDLGIDDKITWDKKNPVEMKLVSEYRRFLSVVMDEHNWQKTDKGIAFNVDQTPALNKEENVSIYERQERTQSWLADIGIKSSKQGTVVEVTDPDSLELIEYYKALKRNPQFNLKLPDLYFLEPKNFSITGDKCAFYVSSAHEIMNKGKGEKKIFSLLKDLGLELGNVKNSFVIEKGHPKYKKKITVLGKENIAKVLEAAYSFQRPHTLAQIFKGVLSPEEIKNKGFHIYDKNSWDQISTMGSKNKIMRIAAKDIPMVDEFISILKKDCGIDSEDLRLRVASSDSQNVKKGELTLRVTGEKSIQKLNSYLESPECKNKKETLCFMGHDTDNSKKLSLENQMNIGYLKQKGR